MNQKPTEGVSSTAVNYCSLKRKRPPNIEIPNVLQEIRADRLKLKELTPKNDAVCFGGVGVGVSSIKGKKKFMKDTYRIFPCLQGGNSNKRFFGVYDGHGGKKAAEFVAENLHTNVLEMMDNCTGDEAKVEAVKAGYLKTDREFLKQIRRVSFFKQEKGTSQSPNDEKVDSWKDSVDDNEIPPSKSRRVSGQP